LSGGLLGALFKSPPSLEIALWLRSFLFFMLFGCI
jgi:hypothetical protein